MPKIALIQDGTEVVRQWVADVARCFESCCRTLSRDEAEEYSLSVFIDEQVGSLFEGIDTEQWACLVFASNALLSGQVESSLTRHSARLHRYIAAGGGILVLHQQRDSLAPLLPSRLLPTTAQRLKSERRFAPLLADEQDVLLRYPLDVAWSTLRDLSDDEIRETGEHGSDLWQLYFKTLDGGALPSALKPVLSSPDDGVVLIARTGDHVPERVVVATPPLDWQSARPGQDTATSALLVNALRYAAAGTPRRLVWRREEGISNQLLVQWLAIDGGAALLSAPARERELNGTERWLLSTTDAFVVPEDRLAWVEHKAEVQRFLNQGGVLLAVADVASGATRVTARIGQAEERTLASNLYAELRAVEGWRTVEYAFELRNIVRALAFVGVGKEDETLPAAIDPRSDLDELVPQIRDRLAEPEHRDDLSSSIALAETLARLAKDTTKRFDDSLGWLEDEAARRRLDLALQIQAALALIDSTASSADFLKQAAEVVGSATSLAPIVRALDSVAILVEAQLLQADSNQAVRLTELACDKLDASPGTLDYGWMSVEATAQITRGLVALHACLGPDDPHVTARVVKHIAVGATALRRALHRYERNAKGVAWLASIVHAVIAADRAFPIGLQRLASLEWPDREARGAASARAERSLLQELAFENEKLRVGRRELEQQLHKQAQQRLAASIGRGTATLVPVAGLAFAAGVVLRQVGWDSLGGLVANLALLVSLLLAALAGVFTALARWHLLAGPAPRIRQWIEDHLVPAAATAGKVKRG